MLEKGGKKIVEMVQKYVSKVKRNSERKVKVSLIFESRKPSSILRVKYETKSGHLHYLMYYFHVQKQGTSEH